MAYKQKGWTPFTKKDGKSNVLPEVKLTAKYPSKKAKRKGEERKLRQKLHSNPVIRAVHRGTDKAADVILDVGQVASGTAAVKAIGKLYRAKKTFDLKKYGSPIIRKIKKTTKAFTPIVADDVVLGTVRTKKEREEKRKQKK